MEPNYWILLPNVLLPGGHHQRCPCVLGLLLQDGDTPLISAARKGCLEVVWQLVAAGADVTTTNKVSESL
jgi:hypothetical protein